MAFHFSDWTLCDPPVVMLKYVWMGSLLDPYMAPPKLRSIAPSLKLIGDATAKIRYTS